MKPIKFDLPLNGTKVHNLEELRNNLTTEILELQANGLLLKWLRIRGFTAEAEKTTAITTENRSDRWLALLDIFGLISTELNIYEIIEGSDINARVELAKKPELLNHLQLMLLKNGDESVQIALAENSNLSAKIQSELAHKGSLNVQMALANNPCLIDELQIYLIKTDSDDQKHIHELNRILAKNTGINNEAQWLLVEDLDSYVRGNLAENPSLNQCLYEKIKSDKYAIQDFAKNPSLSENEQTLLLDADEYVRYHLARNASLSKNVQLKLACDVVKIQKILASNPVIDVEVQAKLVSNDPEVQICLAKNPSLAIEHQSQLLLNGNIDVRLALFSNRTLDKNVKLQLVQLFSLSDFNSAESDLIQQKNKFEQLDSDSRSYEYGDENYRKHENAEDEYSRIQDKCSGILDVLIARCDVDDEFSNENILKIMSMQCMFMSNMASRTIKMISG